MSKQSPRTGQRTTVSLSKDAAEMRDYFRDIGEPLNISAIASAEIVRTGARRIQRMIRLGRAIAPPARFGDVSPPKWWRREPWRWPPQRIRRRVKRIEKETP